MVAFVQFSSLFFVALVLGPSLAHLFELPNKIHLGAEQYLLVQQIYRGWALLGVVVFAAVASTAAQAVLVRKQPVAFRWTLAALACLVISQVLFWMFTFPANRATENWTNLPPGWQELRAQWEYSHAAAAVCNLLAHAALVLALIRARRAGRA